MPFLPQERAIAISEGKAKYFTGRPCKNGHIAERRVNGGCCVICEAEKYKRWSASNPEKVKESSRKNYLSNADKHRAYAAEYRKKNPEKAKAATEKSRRENRSLYTRLQIERQKKVKQASPDWLSKDDINWMNAIYKASKDIKDENGVDTSVDHIIPIKGRDVCGLHVPWNLRVTTRSYNSQKLNNMEDHSPTYQQVGTIMVHESALPWNLRS